MALVSISEASRLTGKARSTIQRYMRQGKLSKIIDATGEPKIDTSELNRVFGIFTGVAKDMGQNNELIQHATPNIELLLHEVNHLKKIIEEKDKLIAEKDKSNNDLRNFLHLLENKENSIRDTVADDTPPKKWYHLFRKKTK